MDAVPGRINETWFKAEKVGTYYGQCSELCGIKHAFMPITVRVVSEADYTEWLTGAKIKFAKEIIEEEEKGTNGEVATPLSSDIPALRKIKTFSESKVGAATSDFA